jgi:hypothetical protein
MLVSDEPGVIALIAVEKKGGKVNGIVQKKDGRNWSSSRMSVKEKWASKKEAVDFFHLHADKHLCGSLSLHPPTVSGQHRRRLRPASLVMRFQ